VVNVLPHPPLLMADSGKLLQANRAPVWSDLDLLDTVRLLRLNNPRIAIDSLVQTLYQKQNLRGHTAFFSEDSTRKQLGKAVDEYENVLFIVEAGVRKVTEGDSLVACCPSCVGTTGSSYTRKPQMLCSQTTHIDQALVEGTMIPFGDTRLLAQVDQQIQFKPNFLIK
jgi:hypothetical protein